MSDKYHHQSELASSNEWGWCEKTHDQATLIHEQSDSKNVPIFILMKYQQY